MDKNINPDLTELKFKTIIDYLYVSKQSHRDKTAFIAQDKPVSYSEFASHVEDCAKALHEAGIQAGFTVALMLPNVLEFCILYFALLRQGVRIIPINIMLNSQELHHILEDSQAETIIAWDKFTDNVNAATEELPASRLKFFVKDSSQQGMIRFDKMQSASLDHTLPESGHLQKNDDALIFYTAGTSEAPKGAILTHESLSCTMAGIWETLLLADADIILAVLPLFHPFGQMATMNAPIAAGSTIVLLSKLDIDDILTAIEKYKVTCFIAVPLVFDGIARRLPSEEKLKSIRLCIAGGAPLKEETYDIFQSKYNQTILEGYGITECSPLVSCSRIYRQRRRGSVGLPLPDIETVIFNGNNMPVSPGEIGEIGIRSKSLMRGYLNEPQSRQDSLRDGWFFTSDMGMMDSDGYLYLIDRKSDMILKDGFSISPLEIEKALNAHQKVQLAAAIGLSNKVHGEIIRAFVVPKVGETLNAQELSKYCQKHLPKFKCPDEIDIVEDLPRTATGKVLKRELRRKIIESQESSNEKIN
ncbi:MAG: AMP-binding protein [bacterium]